MLSVHQRASDTVQFNTMCLYNKILCIDKKPTLCHFVIKFLFINLIMKYSSLKHVFTQNMFFNLIFNSNKSHIISTACNYGEISK